MRRPSELAERLAQRIRDTFASMGYVATIGACNFRPVIGFWKRVDVYRWQVYMDIAKKGGRFQRIELSSWDTMTECVRNGLSISPPHSLESSWEAHAADSPSSTPNKEVPGG